LTEKRIFVKAHPRLRFFIYRTYAINYNLERHVER